MWLTFLWLTVDTDRHTHIMQLFIIRFTYWPTWYFLQARVLGPKSLSTERLVCNIISSEYFQFCTAHFLCNTIMPLFTNILNFQNDVYHFVTLLYKMTSHFVKMIIPGYFKTFYGAARSRVLSSNFTFYTIQSPRYFKPYLSLITHYLLIFYAKIFSNLQLLRWNFSNFTPNLSTL